MKHGTRAPMGCNLGKMCTEFHPMMCLQSLKKGECFSEHCSYYHVKGTKRHPDIVERNIERNTKTPIHKQSQNNNNKNNGDSFLDVVRQMKAEMKAIQSEVQSLAAILTQTNRYDHPNQVQQGMQVKIPPPQWYNPYQIYKEVPQTFQQQQIQRNQVNPMMVQ